MTETTTEKTVEPVNLSEMTDEQIMNMPPPSEEGVAELSATETETENIETDDTGGADAEDHVEGEGTQEAGSTFVEANADTGNESQTDVTEQLNADTDQVESTEETQPDATDDTTNAGEAEAKLAMLLAPFKAGGRTIKVETPDDLRQLAQMGVDYSRKMADMKPYRQMLQTLKKNDLLDGEKMSFLIDLQNKNPAAMKKFFRESGLDPHDLNFEDGTEFTPNDHMIPEKELALDAVLDDIRETPAFERTAKILTDEWDTASKRVLLDNPQGIKIINDHIASGVYDQIVDVMATERALGRLEGLSDLDGYRKVGDAMYAEGKFGTPNTPNEQSPSPSGQNSQDSAQASGSETVKNRKRAASPTKGSASAGKPKIDLANMTDEQVDALDMASL